MQYLCKILQWAQPLFYFHWMHMFPPVSAGEVGVMGFEINQVSNTTATQCIAPPAFEGCSWQCFVHVMGCLPTACSWTSWMNQKVPVSVWLRFLFGFATARMNKLLPSRMIESGQKWERKHGCSPLWVGNWNKNRERNRRIICWCYCCLVKTWLYPLYF